jgi:hypothetical protein
VTTRGIVEFSVFLLQEYHKEMDKGDSQYLLMFFFALFYTAILNAFQSIVLAFITSRVFLCLWVQTESFELNHYVELREEFERLETVIRHKHHKGHIHRHSPDEPLSSAPSTPDTEELSRDKRCQRNQS